MLEVSIIVVAYLAYEVVRRIVAGSSHEAIGRSIGLIRFEQRLGIFFEPNLQRYVARYQWLVTIFNWIYVWGYLPVIGGVALYLYLRHRSFYTRYRNAFLLSGAMGLVIFATVPVAPPRMFPEFGFVDTVRANSQLYSSLEGTDFVNQFAALPSFHFGWILLVGIAVIQASRHLLVRVGGAVMPLVMLLAILFTGNHYVIDAAAGGALVLLALGAVRFAETRGASLPALRPPRSHRLTH